MKKLIFLLVLFFSVPTNSNAQFVDTIIIKFDIGKYNIDQQQRDILETIKKYPANNYALLIYGYADYLGNPKNNKTLSQRRVDNVVKVINETSTTKPNILIQLGLGQVDTKGSTIENGNPKYRTVHIIVRKQNKEPAPTLNEETKNEDLPFAVSKDVAPSKDTITVEQQMVKIKDNIKVTKIDSAFILQDLFFYRNTYQIVPTSKPVLLALLKTMKQNPTLKIIIEGHICCNHRDGSDTNSPSYLLSIDRASSIYDYLVFNGIAKERLSFVGFGTTKPIIENDEKEEDAIKNRRVEIRIVDK